MWNRIRGPLLAALLCIAAALGSWRGGYAAGRTSQVGWPARFDSASVEWQEESPRRAVVWLNDGGHGYAFGVQLLPNFKDYTEATRVFAFGNEDAEARRLSLDAARNWCRREWNWSETRASAGRMMTVNDYEEKGSGYTMAELRAQEAAKEYRDLRVAYQDLARRLEEARLKLSTLEPTPEK